MVRPWLGDYSPHVPFDLPLPAESMIDVWEASVQARPSAPAVYHFDRAISFAEIDERAERFAALLRDFGIGAGERVAVSLQNDPEFLVAQYGAWKRGAVLVPLSALFKEKEVAFQLADSGARLWLCRDEFAQAQAVERTLALTEFNTALDRQMPDRLRTRADVGVDDLAYLVYTSGTTGSPKGSMALHRNIAFNANAIRA
jgi:long-chain acyl-CoA synthetase